MEFLELYKDYTNVQLLKIVNRPEDYQPKAVETAKILLEIRNVLDSEIKEVENFYLNIKQNEINKQEKINFLKKKAIELVQPIILPNEEFKPRIWLKIFLIVLALQYVWLLYKSVSYFIVQANYNFDFFLFIQIIALLYYSLILYLLFRKKKWGWILLFSDNLIVLLSSLGRIYHYVKYQNYYEESFIEIIIPILLRAAFLLFLFRKDISAYFKVTRKLKINTLLIVGIGTVISVIILVLLTL